jgi:hypothetical protein
MSLRNGIKGMDWIHVAWVRKRNGFSNMVINHTIVFLFCWGGGVILRLLNFMYRRFGTLFIGDKIRKNNRDENAGVFIRETVWFKNSLRQSDGGMTGTGRVRVEKQVVEGKDPQVEACSKYVREKRQCRSEEGVPWDGRDQTIMFQKVVYFL